MFVRTMIWRAAAFAALPMLLAAAMPADDVRPTDAEERFKTKYGQYPPYLQQEQKKRLEAQRRKAATDEAERTRQAQRTAPASDTRTADTEKQSVSTENDRQ